MATYTKQCEHCHKTFTTVTWWAKYCSQRCKLNAWRAAQKQQKKQADASKIRSG